MELTSLEKIFMSVWLQKPCKIFRMVLYDVFSKQDMH